MWSFEPEQLIHREQLLDDILQYRDIDGITLLGGEPLQQAPNTRWLLSSIRRSSGCSTVLYTGFTYSELVKRKDWALLREHCDLMITGRYSSSLRNTNLRWRGSSNQELIYLAGAEFLWSRQKTLTRSKSLLMKMLLSEFLVTRTAAFSGL
ncbi:hypothetical protein BJJ97_20170 [Pectobacterium polaris]|nr:hypothetical protein BJJ97_20170 [Pectobacterium polaris]